MAQYGTEVFVWAEIKWGGGAGVKYGSRGMPGISGALLVNASISKTAQVGSNSGISKSCTLVLDDTDGGLKNVYDNTVTEGSLVAVWQRLIDPDGSYADALLLSGQITDTTWDEGERTLTLSCESVSGTSDGQGSGSGQSSDLGYAPEENAWPEMNNNAAGKNWPIVFGNALKIPGVRVEYSEATALTNTISKSDATYEIDNGESLPQGTTITLKIGRLYFVGSMSGSTFTPSIKNKPIYTNLTLADRGPTDSTSRSVFWTPPAFTGNLAGMYVIKDYGTYKFVNYVIGRDPEDENKWFCSVPWPSHLTSDDTLLEVAPFPREEWDTDFEIYTDGGNIMTVVAAGGWRIPKGTPVIYVSETGYTDKYIVNLYPGSVGEVWGKRTFYGKEIWARIPSSYYTVIGSDSITTEPGAVVRNPTSITFDQALSSRECENWKDEIYVNVSSSLTANPKLLVQWVVDNFTTYTFDSANSDLPSVSTNFAYFQTTDAISFIQEYAWQTASVIIIDGLNLRYQSAAKNPALVPVGRKHTLTKGITLMKTIKLGTTDKEDLNTKVSGSYVTDYSGEDSSRKEVVVKQNDDKFGNKEESHEFWAFVCEGGVRGVTEFWSNRNSQAYKTFEADLIIQQSGIEAYDTALLDYPGIITNASGFFESVTHETSSPHVRVKVRTAVPVGSTSDDPGYWNVPFTACPTPSIGGGIDYEVPQDDSCPTYYEAHPITRERYQIFLTLWPLRIRRFTPFTIKAEIRDSDGNVAAINTAEGETEIRIMTPWGRDRFWKQNCQFVAGLFEQQFVIRGGLSRLTVDIDVEIRSNRRDIISANTNIVPQVRPA